MAAMLACLSSAQFNITEELMVDNSLKEKVYEPHVERHDAFGITLLNDQNFDAEIKAHEYLFVLFYSSESSDIGGLLHDYYTAAGRLADKLGHDEPDADPLQRHYLAKIDMDKNK